MESSGTLRVGSQDTEDTKYILLINDRVDFTTHELGNKICLKGGFTLIFVLIHNLNYKPNNNNKNDKADNPAISVSHSPSVI